MFERIVGSFLGRRDAKRLLKNPIVHVGGAAIRLHWSENPKLTKDFPDDFVRDEGERITARILEVAESSDPRMSNREAIAKTVIEFSCIHVWMVPPVPEPDDSGGYRGRCGVTGELKAHLPALAHIDAFQEFLGRFSGVDINNPATLWNLVILEWRRRYAWFEIFNAMRLVISDWSKEPAGDWFYPYAMAMCGCQEYNFRSALNLPPSLADTPAEASSRYMTLGIFHQYVKDGIFNPYLEWQTALAEQIPKEWFSR